MISSLAAVTGESLRAEILPDYYPAQAKFLPRGGERGGGGEGGGGGGGGGWRGGREGGWDC